MARHFAAACGLVVMLATPAWAETRSPSGTPAAAPVAAGPAADATAPDEAAREALAARYYAAMHLDQLVEQGLGGFVQSAAAMKGRALTDADRAAVDKAMAPLRATEAEVMPTFRNRIIKVFARAYTVEELSALVAFYESPPGRSAYAKSARVQAEMSPIVADVFAALQTSWLKHGCGGGGCGQAPQP